MKIIILKQLGDVGVITDCKAFISDPNIEMVIVGASGGTLTIGARSYAVKPTGEVLIPEYEIVLGESKVTYNDGERLYDCGKLNRNGRFFSVINVMDKLVITCALLIADQQKQIDALNNELDVLKKQYGISIVGG